MIKKISMTTLSVLMAISMFCMTPIFADYTDSSTSNLDGSTFRVTTTIASNKLSSNVTAIYGSTAQMWAENTSIYATSSEKYSREIAIAPGSVSAYASVTSGYAIKKCTGRGNATLTNGKSSTLTVVVNA